MAERLKRREDMIVGDQDFQQAIYWMLSSDGVRYDEITDAFANVAERYNVLPEELDALIARELQTSETEE